MKENRHILKGRPFIKTRKPDLTFFCHQPALAVCILLSSLPAFHSCRTSDFIKYGDTDADVIQEVVISLKSSSEERISTLDIFFFNDDRLRRLDSWQHMDSPGSNIIEAASRQGRKTVVALANAGITEDECRSIRSYDALNKLYADLHEDNPDSPIMNGEGSVSAGYGRPCGITLEPMLSEITISSISCDFHSRPYAGEMLKDVKVYLTNVSSRYPLAGDYADSAPESILNHGHLSEEDIAGFHGRPLIFGELPDIGESVLFPELKLYCYRNTLPEEGLAAPFTRLVIEGTVAGTKTYYPININRGTWSSGDTPGVERNCSYSYDLTITRKGVSDPDTAIELEDVQCRFRITPWKDKERHTITY